LFGEKEDPVDLEINETEVLEGELGPHLRTKVWI